MNKKYLYSFLLVLMFAYTVKAGEKIENTKENRIYYADPTILRLRDKYYLTGTSAISPKGFTMMESSDLKKWKDCGYIFTCGSHAFGDKGFWAPQIFQYNNKWYLAYTANEQVAIAEADRFNGPYSQTLVKPVDKDEKNIDPFVFQDDDGKFYLYHVRFDHGNYIWVAQFDIKTGSIDKSTLTRCLNNTESWERTSSYPSDPVMEGPTVIKRKGKYYLFYSANHFMSIDYSVGYAVADSPMGPWKKPTNNLLIHRSVVGENGCGHGDVFTDKHGDYYYVYHVHNSDSVVSPRQTRIVPLHFNEVSPGNVIITVKKNEVIKPFK